jgi:hypothetical protein
MRMANVKPTKAIWEKIDAQITKMYAARLAHASAWSSYDMTESEIVQIITDEVFPVHERTMCQNLGGKYFSTTDFLSVVIDAGDLKVDYRAGLPSVIYAPDSFSAHYRPVLVCRDSRIADIAKRRFLGMSNVTKELDVFRENLKKAYDTSPSINALAKIWPAIVDLLPDEVRARMTQNTARRTVKDLTNEIDSSSLSVSLLMAKVGA